MAVPKPNDTEKRAIAHAPCFRCGALIKRNCMKPTGEPARTHYHRVRTYLQFVAAQLGRSNETNTSQAQQEK